jgi:hypothetical protein
MTGSLAKYWPHEREDPILSEAQESCRELGMSFDPANAAICIENCATDREETTAIQLCGFSLREALARPRANIVSAIESEQQQPFEHSAVIQGFQEERDEILRFKWLESEKAHQDIGFERALLRWIIQHRPTWLEQRRRNQSR